MDPHRVAGARSRTRSPIRRDGVQRGRGFPKWAAAAGFYGPVFGWYLSLIIDTAVLGGLAAGLALLASRLAFRPFVLFGTNRILERFFDRVQAPLLLPCRDSKLVYAQKETQRDEEYLAYTRQVRAANDERRPLTRVLLPVARARGTLRSRGIMQAPVRDAQMCLDGESIRQHVLILGGTGSGKTRLVIRPLSSRIMTLIGDLIAGSVPTSQMVKARSGRIFCSYPELQTGLTSAWSGPGSTM